MLGAPSIKWHHSRRRAFLNFLMVSLIQLPEGIVSASLAYSGQLFDDFSPFIFLAMGLAIAFAIVNVIRGKSPDEKEDELL